MRAWLCTTVPGGETSWQSNDGYDDVLGTQYVYDSGVAYHRQVAQDDIILIREHDLVLGVSRIDRIDTTPSQKRRKRCPHCGRTGVEFRVRAGVYVCTNSKCRETFPEPDSILEPVTKYTAMYGSRWQALDGALTYAQLSPYLEGVAQNAIRPCDVEKLGERLAGVRVSIPSGEAPAQDHRIAGGRRATEIQARVGQGKFRAALLQKHGLTCAVTGPCPAEVLEAAHLLPFATYESHDVDCGVLLRADIHKLFDSGLLAINPDTYQVEIGAELMHYPHYRELHGRRIVQEPSKEALRARFQNAASLVG